MVLSLGALFTINTLKSPGGGGGGDGGGGIGHPIC